MIVIGKAGLKIVESLRLPVFFRENLLFKRVCMNVFNIQMLISYHPTRMHVEDDEKEQQNKGIMRILKAIISGLYL